MKIKIITDPIEAAAIELAKHKGLDWNMIKREWKDEQREQARVLVGAMDRARRGEYDHAYPDDMI